MDSFILRDRRFCNVWFNSHEILYLIELMKKKLFGLNLDFFSTYIYHLFMKASVVQQGDKLGQ